MIVNQYEMRFTKLSCYAAFLILTEKKILRRFIEGLSYSLRYGVDERLRLRIPSTRLLILLGYWSLFAGKRGRI